MTDKNYITPSQYEKIIRKMKEYVDKSIPYIDDPKVIFTVPVNTALEIFNSEAKAMEFDKPSNININYEFIVNYNNKDINSFIEEDEVGKCIRYIDDNIDITFIPGYDINDNVNENKMVVGISRLKSNTITTDIVLKQVKVKYLNNKYLKKDVAIKNSITIGSRDATTSIGQYSFSSGRCNTASGIHSHAEGFMAIAEGKNSHAEGEDITASGKNSHAEGSGTIASGTCSHAEGVFAKAEGDYSHAEGNRTIAKGTESHAEGIGTIANLRQHVQGKFNIEDTAKVYAHIVGNGSSTSERSNAHTLDWSGNAWYAGDVQANNVPHVISERVVVTVPAASISAKKTEIDNNNGADPVRISVDTTVTYDPTKSYYVKYNNTQYHVVYTEGVFGIVGDGCECLIMSSNGNTVLMVFSLDTTNITDMQLIEKDIKKLDTMYIPDDLNVNKSITVGARNGKTGTFSSSFGLNCKASGDKSHAEGHGTTASGESSHAEGDGTTASGFISHAEGDCTIASGYASHTEGGATTASGNKSHAEGYNTTASSNYQHVQGKFNIDDAEGKYAHIVGNGASNTARSNAHTLDWKGNAWFAGQVEGTNLPYNISSRVLATIPANTINLDNEITVNNISINNDRRYYIEFLGIKKLCSLSLDDEDENVIICSINNYKIKVYNGSANIIISISKINNDITTTDTFTDLIIYEEENKYLDSKYLEYDLILQNSISLGRVGNIGPGSSAIGYGVRASGYYSHAEGEGTKASGDDSHAEGSNTMASSYCSHAEGYNTTASTHYSHAEGNHTTASGESSHAEGYTTTASGDYSHAEGNVTKASAFCSHAEGNHTTASGDYSHAEGFYTTASASGSHAEGVSTTASGKYSHAEGDNTTASGSASHAEGEFTIASGEFQHVQGKFNIEDTENKYLHIVGNGKYDYNRSNAHTLDWNGNGWYAGKLSQDGTPTADKDLTTKKYVDDTVGANKVNICADEEITNMLTEVLGAGYSATE